MYLIKNFFPKGLRWALVGPTERRRTTVKTLMGKSIYKYVFSLKGSVIRENLIIMTMFGSERELVYGFLRAITGEHLFLFMKESLESILRYVNVSRHWLLTY